MSSVPREVHWYEGMFLRPHQLQAAQQHWAYQSNLGEKWDLHHNWGLRSIDIDLDALSNHRFVVRSLKARMRDGTLIAVSDGDLSPVELKTAFERETTIKVLLALPKLREGRKNVDRQSAEVVRFLLDTREIPDENTGGNPQPVEVRLPNLRLLLSTQDREGYECLEIGGIVKSTRPGAPPELDINCIPPLLACDAWKILINDILQSIYDRIGGKLDTLAKIVANQNINFDSTAQGEPRTLYQLRTLNEAYAVLGVQCFAGGVHPLAAYLELCRVVGRLAIIGDSRRVPKLPEYNHDDLGNCFYEVKKYIDALLDMVEKPIYEEVPFVGAGLRMQVTLRSLWLENNWQMYVGVQTSLSVEECVRMLTVKGQLDMKMGSSDNVDKIFMYGERGLIFNYKARPPKVLPSTRGLVYFEVNRDSQKDEWARVSQRLELAIRLNEHLIQGNIQGQRKLTIKTSGQPATMEFTLYLLPKDVK